MTKRKLPVGWTVEEVKLRLEVYSKSQLDKHLSTYSKAFIKGEEAWLLKQEQRIAKATDSALLNIKTKKQTKAAALTINAVPFLHPEVFKRFVQYLPEDTQTILEEVVLNGPIEAEEIEERFGIEGFVTEEIKNWHGRLQQKASPKLRFFNSPDHYYYHDNTTTYSLPHPIRELIVALLFVEPRIAHSYTPEKDKEGEFVFLGESIIQEELPGLLIHLQQKPPKLTKKGRPSITTVRSVSKKLKLREFYPESSHADLKHIRASAVIGLLAVSRSLSVDNMPELVKSLFEHEFVTSFHLPVHLLSYINGMSRVKSYSMTNRGLLYKDLVGSIPEGKWYKMEDLEFALKTQLFAAYPIDSHAIGDLSIKLPSEDYYSGFREVYLLPYKAERFLLWPSFRAMIFMMASWGLLDIIYSEPDLSLISKTADSPYDGIKGIRLNALGAYVLGLSKSYTSTVKAPFTLELDTDSLSILLSDGDQDRAAMAIASFAKPFGDRRFFTDAGLFLGDCKSAGDLNHKISLFKSIFSGELPPNWKAFFDEIKQKVNPLEEEEDFAIFRIDQENRSLLQLIVRDPELKRYCLKAEGFLILIAKKDINKFRKRLQTFGYLLE